MEWKFDANGLLPVITQDYKTKDVLMLAYMNQEAYDKTAATGKVHYYSRSRKELWLKGETSGHFQLVKQIAYDCDKDTLLIFVEQIGGACHTGHYSCFYRTVDSDAEISEKVFEVDKVYSEKNKSVILEQIYQVILDRQANPKPGSYTNYLLEKGIDKTLKKVGEESAEVIIGAKNSNKSEITCETADLLYHLSVMLVQTGVNWSDVYGELEKRRASEK